jgi:hypothetical protein
MPQSHTEQQLRLQEMNISSLFEERISNDLKDKSEYFRMNESEVPYLSGG